MTIDSPRNKFAPPNAHAVGRADDASATITQEEAWAAIIGPSNTHGYVERFRRLSLGGSAAWHWPAFLTTLPWLMYRKMWIGALVYMVAPVPVLIALLAMFPRFAPGVILAWWLGLALLPGVMANRWYFHHCASRIRDVRARGGSKEQMLARLDAAGGTNAMAVIALGVLALGGAAVLGFTVALPVYRATHANDDIRAAVQAGFDVAAAVGRHYEQTGKMPSDTDVQAMVERVPHPSAALRGVDIEPSGVLVLDVQASPTLAGKIHLVPEADSGHLYWTCLTDDRKVYLPRTCRLVRSYR